MINGNWISMKASEIYSLVFGMPLPEDSELVGIQDDLRTVFPEIRFSKFSVNPELRLLIEDGHIIIQSYFVKLGKEYTVELPVGNGPDYGFAGKTWCYYSGDYYQLKEILKSSAVNSSEISFKQYINIINEKEKYPGVSIHDLVGKNLTNSFVDRQTSKPCELKANLYPYQAVGFNWLKYITDAGCGCVLGDFLIEVIAEGAVVASVEVAHLSQTALVADYHGIKAVVFRQV